MVEMLKITFVLLFLIVPLSGQTAPEYSYHDILLDSRVTLNDFILVRYSDAYWSVFACLSNVSSMYIQWVELDYDFYFEGDRVEQKSSYIDYDTYENSGLVPGSVGLISSLTEIVQFDSIIFDVTYQTDSGLMKKLNQVALSIETTAFNEISFSDTYHDWVGSVKNISNTPLQYPQIFSCFFEDNKLVSLNNTYINVMDNIINPNEIGDFNRWIILPDPSDSVKYLCHYSIDLTEQVEIPTNVPSASLMKKSFKLLNNYPNPFNSSTTINFKVNRVSYIEINIYDVSGRLALPNIKNYYNSGSHKLSIDMNDFASGVYYYELRSDEERYSNSMLLIR
ncbi:T9SS type A sorting domain-containing protein [candidate division KSB1 bacterium]|nr:T9SS type A sorting domain-containing protein [candidate division KSB1 bacterium]